MVESDGRSTTYVMSFWRCGSNFVCNVLSRSSHTRFVTIYDPELPLMADNYAEVSLIKSHAPSYEHLMAEHGAYVPRKSNLPQRYLILWRDPRDMFISLYDWMCARYQKDFPVEGFLDSVNGYAVAGAGTHTFADGFRKFVKNWYFKEPEPYNVRSFRYEDILKNKISSFKNMIEFTKLDCELDTSLMDQKVKLGSSDRDKRGVAGAWKRYGDRYRVLLCRVEEMYSKEIKLLGYA